MALGDGFPALAELGVTFGGFSPTLMDGVQSSRKIVEQFEEIHRQRKEAQRKQRELELARSSKPRRAADEHGTVWTYVVVDEKVARIIKCEPAVKRVEFPGEIEGYPVYAIGAEALSENNAVEEIVCADSIEYIEPCAFRLNENLRSVVFPHDVTEFKESWVRHCPKLESLVLPGLLDVIGIHVFDNRGLKRLYIGESVYKVEPGAFQNTALDEIVIAEENPFITTDGVGVYSKDFSTLLALAKPVEEFKVLDGCKVLAKKSCYGIEALREIHVPESVEKLEPFALSHSGIIGFVAPSSLLEIDEKAFYYCKSLTSVKLNSGLASLGNSAFEKSALTALRIPASIEHIGTSITARTNVVHSGPDCTLEIDPGCETFFLDGAGGLYRAGEDGAHFVQLIDREMREYEMGAAAVAIDPYAFAYHDSVERVVVKDGVRVIGKSAFRVCSKLKHVELPDSVCEIGEDAFIDTVLEDFRVPAKLEKLGKNALVTQAAHHGNAQPSLRSVEVAEGNESFYIVSGMLCQRRGETSSVIVFASNESHVIIPDEVSHVEEYAFNNARGIDYLELRPGLKTIGTAGLSVWCWIEHIHIEVAEAIEGRSVFDFYFPNTSKGIHSISIGIGGASWVNVPGIMAQYDNSIASSHDYNSPRNSDSISVYEQAKRMVSRLDDPILLTETNRNLFERVFRWNIVEICVDIARHDDRYLIDRLLDFGFINEDNLEEIIASVNRLQDAAMTGYLLEIKRRRFNRSAFDFDL